jgi:hypothetical protein
MDGDQDRELSGELATVEDVIVSGGEDRGGAV